MLNSSNIIEDRNTVRKIRLFFLLFSLLFTLSIGCSRHTGTELRDGDIIFQTSLSPQSTAIQRATHSKYSHMGIIFFRNGYPFVFEAVRTVRYTPLDKWIARGKDSHYVVKRLDNANELLTPDALASLKATASTFEGKPYDLTFEWSDDRMYCSELVWKIYDKALHIRIGQLQRLRDFDLSDNIVAREMEKRYDGRPPLDEPVISPAQMFASNRLILIEKH